MHAFGRIGCFLAGCCYGIEVDWGIAFGESVSAPNGVPYMPVQLYEAAAEAAICIVIILYVKKLQRSAAFRENAFKLRPLALYFLLYTPVRFVLEFFRGDTVRGYIGFLSTSQFISVTMLAVGIVVWKCAVKVKPGGKSYE